MGPSDILDAIFTAADFTNRGHTHLTSRRLQLWGNREFSRLKYSLLFQSRIYTKYPKMYLWPIGNDLTQSSPLTFVSPGPILQSKCVYLGRKVLPELSWKVSHEQSKELAQIAQRLASPSVSVASLFHSCFLPKSLQAKWGLGVKGYKIKNQGRRYPIPLIFFFLF